MDIKLIPGVDKLIDYTASGIGSTASFFFSRMAARRDAEAKLIAAKGEAQAQQAWLRARPTPIQIISQAQADARKNLVSPDASVTR